MTDDFKLGTFANQFESNQINRISEGKESKFKDQQLKES